MTAGVECWLAFLDMWGFSADVQGRDATEIINVLEDIRSALEGRRSELSWYYMFSDSVVLVQAVETGTPGWSRFVTAINAVQSIAVDHGFTFRGAITAGEMHCAENICFGKPFLQAYHLEQTLAVPILVMPLSATERTGVGLGTVADVPIKGDPGDAMRASFITVKLDKLYRLAETRHGQTISTLPRVAGTWRRLQMFIKPYVTAQL